MESRTAHGRNRSAALVLVADGTRRPERCSFCDLSDLFDDWPELWSALVTDLHMEGMDGRALARHAGTLSPPVPVVLITARPDTLGDAPAPEFAAVLLWTPPPGWPAPSARHPPAEATWTVESTVIDEVSRIHLTEASNGRFDQTSRHSRRIYIRQLTAQFVDGSMSA